MEVGPEGGAGMHQHYRGSGVLELGGGGVSWDKRQGRAWKGRGEGGAGGT